MHGVTWRHGLSIIFIFTTKSPKFSRLTLSLEICNWPLSLTLIDGCPAGRAHAEFKFDAWHINYNTAFYLYFVMTDLKSYTYAATLQAFTCWTLLWNWAEWTSCRLPVWLPLGTTWMKKPWMKQFRSSSVSQLFCDELFNDIQKKTYVYFLVPYRDNYASLYNMYNACASFCMARIPKLWTLSSQISKQYFYCGIHFSPLCRCSCMCWP